MQFCVPLRSPLRTLQFGILIFHMAAKIKILSRKVRKEGSAKDAKNRAFRSWILSGGLQLWNRTRSGPAQRRVEASVTQ
jgi:hypothetical protein